MKILLLLFTLLFSANAFTAGIYKCTAEQAYGLTDDGVLQNDPEEHPNFRINNETLVFNKGRDEFIIDRKTGRFSGGSFIFRGQGETFAIINQGGSATSFKAYFAEPSSGWLLSIEIKEYSDSYKKPFVYVTMPNTVVITGTCIHY